MSDGPCKTTILLLSSESHARAGLNDALERTGYLVLTAATLSEAVELLSTCHVNLLITHPYIDCMPGHEAAVYLRRKRPGLPILMVAGVLADDRYTYRADLDHVHIFPPPFGAEDFLREVAAVLQMPRPSQSTSTTASEIVAQ